MSPPAALRELLLSPPKEDLEYYFPLIKKGSIDTELSADLYPAIFSLEGFEKESYLKVASQQLYILKSTKLITALRTICSMIKFEDEDLDWIDIFSLFEIILRIERELLEQETFFKKFGRSLKALTGFLAEVSWSPTKPERALRTLRLMFRALPDSFFIKERNLLTEKRKYRNQFILKKYTAQGIELKFLPPKAYIGKRYGDKGTAKDVAKDASPSWQKVASSLLPKEDQNEISQN